MLVSFESVESLLVCPRCHSKLARSSGGFRCGAAACPLGVVDSFPVVGSVPVIIDFERSILARHEPDGAGGSSGSLASSRWSLDRMPPALRRWWRPFNDVAARNVGILLERLPRHPLVLVVGGASVGNGVERLYSDPDVRTLAFDVAGSRFVQFVADAHQIPLADASVDAVVVQAVLEHVLDPQTVVAEIHRVLGEEGLVYAETPFLQHVHAGPYDFTRFTGSGHRYLFRRFDEIAAGVVAGPGTQLLWSLDHVVRGLLRSELAGKLARGVFFPLRYLDRAVPERYCMDGASGYYFLGRRTERELSPREIVSYYRGAQRHRSVPAEE